MNRRPEEISNILKEQIKNYKNRIDMGEVGTVVMVGDGIASVYGIRNCMSTELLEFEDGSVGLRVTKENISHELCYRFQKAIVSTSANISGEPSPACFDEISDEIKQGVDYIMLSRQNDTSKSKPSQIIKLSLDGRIQIIRK